MTKAEIAEQIAKSTGLKKSDVMMLIDEFKRCVIDSLCNGENVYLRGFGSFIIRCRSKKTCRDIGRGKKIVRPAHIVPVFKPDKSFHLPPLCQSASSVTIPDSETEIASFAFQGYKDLTKVVIGKSVSRIGNYAFHGCKKLTGIVIPDSVTIIGDHAFLGCSSLTNVEIPNSVTEIKRYAFADCKRLESIVIPETVKHIRRNTFYGCTDLKSCVIPPSVTEIGDYAFQGCTSLESIVIPGSVAKIGVQAFSGCTGLKSVEIGHTVKKIGEGAFMGCPKLANHALILSMAITRQLRELIDKANCQWAYDTCMFLDYDSNDHEDEEDSPFTWEQITENTGILHVEMFPPNKDDIIYIMEELAEEQGLDLDIKKELATRKITAVVQLDTINQYIEDYFRRHHSLRIISADVSKGEFEYVNR
jgi:nucleoid DNA-binding protein